MAEALEYATPPTQLRHSRSGVASTLCGTSSFLLLLASLLMQASPSGTIPIYSIAAIGLVFSLPVIGFIFAIVGIRSRQHKRSLAVIGLIINGLLLLLFGALLTFLAFANVHGS